MGTSAFAADILSGLLDAGQEMAAVYTRVDKPAGRGMELKQPDVKILAGRLGLPVMQPANFRSEESVQKLESLKPDFLIVAAYGLILPQAVLDIPTIAPINVHASLLPRYRGAAPIQRAIMDNWQPQAETGVSIMRMEAGLDTGPVYKSAAVKMGGETAQSLEHKLAALGVRLLLECLPEIASGKMRPVAQDDSLATYAHKLAKEDGQIDWSMPALAVDARIRAVTPWPGAQFTLHLSDKSVPLTVLSGKIAESLEQGVQPGFASISKKSIKVACADNWYELNEIRPQGKKTMTAQAFANGLRNK